MVNSRIQCLKSFKFKKLILKYVPTTMKDASEDKEAFEPPEKRRKTEPAFTTIQSILPDQLVSPISLVEAFVCKIQDKKSISKVVEALKCIKMPSLQHLKRIHQLEVILATESDLKALEGDSSYKQLFEGTKSCVEILEGFLKLKEIDSFCGEIEIRNIPKDPPLLRWQYTDCTKIWACKFHPNQELERLYSNSYFNEQEKKLHLDLMAVIGRISEKFDQKPVGLALNPHTNRVAAIGVESTHLHPLLHTPMALIDRVACSQGGGAYFKPQNLSKNGLSLDGFDPKVLEILQNEFPEVQIGADRVQEGQRILDDDGEDNLQKFGPYICTGYYIYLTEEPCLMCSMALNHSRAKIVFFNRTSHAGGLKTLTKLHTIPDLNHHFKVFCIS